MAKDIDHLAREAAPCRLNRRGFLGRAAALGVALPLVSQLLASAALAQEACKGGQLKLGLQGGAATDVLDPAKCTSQVCFVEGRNWGETLVMSDPETGEPVPMLAESWESSDDAKQWTFKIRKGVKFHNDKEMTPDDVLATLRRHSDEKSESGALGVMETISDMQVEGDNLIITLDDANADLPLLLSDYHLVIQPNGGVDDPNAGIGTGPYRVEKHEPGVRSLFRKVEDHWRKDVGHADSIEVLVINDNTARVAALASGQVHFINRVEPKTVALLERSPNVKVVTTPGRGHYVFLMHTDKEPFNNPDLRMALKLAIDRDGMVEKILQGYGRVGNDFPINETYALFPEGIEQRKYDPELARQYYEKSGHSGPIVLRTSDVAFPGAVDAAVLFQQSAAKAGIDIEIKREPGDGYWSNVWNVQPFSASYWGGRPTQDQMYTTAYYSKADWNDTKWFRPEFDKLLIEARGTLDEAERKELYRQMAMMVRDDGGVILPMFNDFINAHGADVGGWIDDLGNDMMSGYVGLRLWLPC